MIKKDILYYLMIYYYMLKEEVLVSIIYDYFHQFKCFFFFFLIKDKLTWRGTIPLNQLEIFDEEDKPSNKILFFSIE